MITLYWEECSVSKLFSTEAQRPLFNLLEPIKKNLSTTVCVYNPANQELEIGRVLALSGQLV